MKWRENLAIKVLAFLLAVAAFAGAAVMAWYQIVHFDVLWDGDDLADGFSIRALERQDFHQVLALFSLYREEAQGVMLSPYSAQRKTELEEAYSAEQTNLRWQIWDNAGNVCLGNTEQDLPVPAKGLYLNAFDWQTSSFDAEIQSGLWQSYAPDAQTDKIDTNNSAVTPDAVVTPNAVATPDDEMDAGNVVVAGYGEDWREALQQTADEYLYGELELTEEQLDAVWVGADGSTEVLVITDAQGTHVYGPTVRSVLDTNEYGYQFDWSWCQVEEPRALTEDLRMIMWLEDGLPVNDAYRQTYTTLQGWYVNRGLLLAATLFCAAAGVLLSIFLCAGAGHKRGVEGISLHGFHRIPGDLLLAAVVLGITLAVGLPGEVLVGCWEGWYYVSISWQMALTGVLAACVFALALAWVVTFAARCKAHTLLKNTLIWRFCRLLGRLCRRGWRALGRAVAAVPLIWQVVIAGLVYLLFTILTFQRTSGLWLLGTIAALVYLCLWAYQWRRIREGTAQIVGGHPDSRIDTDKMLPDLRQHAEQLNALSGAIDSAVDERLKSERFKAELITNVSHDLKTPLTSIINYVDLLKKEDIANEKAREYIDVLDRKSQRLKKLTEDLVEASKASTGALTVNRERLDVVQLVRQAAGEYEEKLTAAGLSLVPGVPEEPLYIHADGRHVWRVLDNLLGNCAKYALEGTRVYLDVTVRDGNAVITVKNVSRQPLNVPAEQLMERFVRGDESRTTEGSGLGLSIARSLTELQGGQFSLHIDGDLFKATVIFPQMQQQ